MIRLLFTGAFLCNIVFCKYADEDWILYKNKKNGSDDLEVGVNVVMAKKGTHEGLHSAQDYADFYTKTKDPKTGKYKDPKTNKKAKKLGHDDTRHEQEAMAGEEKAADQMRKKYKNNQ